MRHTGIRSPVNDDIIQYLMRTVWFVHVIVLSLLAYQLLNQITICALILRSHDRALEAQPQAYGDAVGEGCG